MEIENQDPRYINNVDPRTCSPTRGISYYLSRSRAVAVATNQLPLFPLQRIKRGCVAAGVLRSSCTVTNPFVMPSAHSRHSM